MRLITIQACAHGFGMQGTKEERDDKRERQRETDHKRGIELTTTKRIDRQTARVRKWG